MKRTFTRILLGLTSLFLAGCAEEYIHTVTISLTGETKADGDLVVCAELAYWAHCPFCDPFEVTGCDGVVLDFNTFNVARELEATLRVEPSHKENSEVRPETLKTELRSKTAVFNGTITEQSEMEPQGDGTATISVKAIFTQ